jgi:hypothetical protein
VHQVNEGDPAIAVLANIKTGAMISSVETQKKSLLKHQATSIYIHMYMSEKNGTSAVNCTGELRRPSRQPEGKYFDYFAFNIVDCNVNRGLLRSGQGLTAAHSRKLSVTLGGSTSTHPGVRKITLKTCNFVDISNTAIPTVLGGSTTTSPSIVIVILRQQLDYIIVNYSRADHATPDKS